MCDDLDRLIVTDGIRFMYIHTGEKIFFRDCRLPLPPIRATSGQVVQPAVWEKNVQT